MTLSVKSTSDHKSASQNNRYSITLNLDLLYKKSAAAFAANEGVMKGTVDERNRETVAFVCDKSKFLE